MENIENNVHILIVEDSPTQAVQLQYLLEKNHFQVTMANNGKQALGMLQHITPTIIISDIVMPEMNGYALCTAIKENDHLKDIPVILLTSLADPEDVINGLACGANNFIIKPYHEDFLLSRIKYILANMEIRKTASSQMSIEIMFREKKYFLNSERVQMIDLLLSTYEAAIQRNLDFQITNEKLQQARDELESRVQERTAELSTANVQLQKEIEERKRAEDSLRESEGRFKDLFNYMTDGVAIYKAIDNGNDFLFLDFNKAGERTSDIKKDDVIGQSVLKMFPGVKDMGLFEVFQQVWKTGDPIFHPLSLYKDKRLEQWVQNWVYKLPSGEIVAIYSDETIRKKAEDERLKLEEQFRQSQKMEAIGTLAGGVAHDFNNILTTIIGNAQLALMDVEKEGPLREEIEEIKKAGERAASLTRQLLAFSRKQIVQPKTLDLNEVIADMEKMLGRLIGEDVDLLMIQRPELWQVEADPGQIEQILMNLAVNAKDAMPMGGKLTIETANVDLDDNYLRNHGIKGEQPGPYVMLAVSDTGIGMNKEIQEHIFDPFFTTKEIGKGTGLGLSTVYGIVKQNKGLIWIYSEPGQGSTFKIYLSAIEGDVASEKKDQSPVTDHGGSETILVVEDDESLRRLARIVLEQNGYKILEAENGEDALRVAEAYEGSIDLMITDVVMPKMGGKEVVKRLQVLYSHMKVIYMSGYTDNAIAHHGILETGLNFIQKPFTPNVLAHRVRDILNS